MCDASRTGVGASGRFAQAFVVPQSGRVPVDAVAGERLEAIVELGILLGRPVVEQLAEAVLARTPQPLDGGLAVTGQVERVGARFSRHDSRLASWSRLGARFAVEVPICSARPARGRLKMDASHWLPPRGCNVCVTPLLRTVKRLGEAVGVPQ